MTKSNMPLKGIAITGSAGLLDFHLAKQPQSQGHQVRSFGGTPDYDNV